MITRAMKAQLQALGYSDDQIANMRPKEAHNILARERSEALGREHSIAALGEVIDQWKAAFGVGEIRTLDNVIEMAAEAINPKLNAALLAVAAMDVRWTKRWRSSPI